MTMTSVKVLFSLSIIKGTRKAVTNILNCIQLHNAVNFQKLNVQDVSVINSVIYETLKYLMNQESLKSEDVIIL